MLFQESFIKVLDTMIPYLLPIPIDNRDSLWSSLSIFNHNLPNQHFRWKSHPVIFHNITIVSSQQVGDTMVVYSIFSIAVGRICSIKTWVWNIFDRQMSSYQSLFSADVPLCDGQHHRSLRPHSRKVDR